MAALAFRSYCLGIPDTHTFANIWAPIRWWGLKVGFSNHYRQTHPCKWSHPSRSPFLQMASFRYHIKCWCLATTRFPLPFLNEVNARNHRNRPDTQTLLIWEDDSSHCLQLQILHLKEIYNLAPDQTASCSSLIYQGKLSNLPQWNPCGPRD